MAQILRPISDVALASWVPTPASPATAWDKIDEVTPVDTDYISSPSAPTGAAHANRVRLSAGTDPLMSTGYIFRYRIRKNLSDGAQINAEYRIDENGTQRAVRTKTDVSNTWTTFEETLTTGEADTIVDHTLLERRLTPTQV